jgi:hypothetical protein
MDHKILSPNFTYYGSNLAKTLFFSGFFSCPKTPKNLFKIQKYKHGPLLFLEPDWAASDPNFTNVCFVKEKISLIYRPVATQSGSKLNACSIFIFVEF